jgi:hypothetical protein
MLIIGDTLLTGVDNWLQNEGTFVYWKYADTLEFKMDFFFFAAWTMHFQITTK